MKNAETVRRTMRALRLLAQVCKLAGLWLGVWACASIDWAAHSTSAGQFLVRLLVLVCTILGGLALMGWAYAADEEYHRAARMLARMERQGGGGCDD